jgi:hypothetical protein
MTITSKPFIQTNYGCAHSETKKDRQLEERTRKTGNPGMSKELGEKEKTSIISKLQEAETHCEVAASQVAK